MLKAVGEGVSAYGVEVNLSAVKIADIEKQLPYITGIDSCFVFIDDRQPENR